MAGAFSQMKDEAGTADRDLAGEIIVVDLDRTLSATDLSLECLLSFIGHHPLELWKLPGWARDGKSRLKSELARRSMPDIETIPLNPEVVEYLEKKRARGARLVLASASNIDIVQAVADRLGMFDEVIGSTADQTFKGATKAAELNRRYGNGNYVYLGDSPADLAVWPHARKAVTVGASKSLRRKAEAVSARASHISVASREKGQFWRHLAKAMRPHQWSKNALIFVPILAAHALSAGSIAAAMLAFIVFSLTASSVYLTNDMLDLDADRAHPRKRFRPFAAGNLALKDGMIAAALLLVTAFTLAIAFLPPLFLLVLVGYFLSTLSYSLKLKKKVMVDVFLLAGLYTFRVLAGGAAAMIPMSPWLLGFCLFFFLALAIVKRVAELVDTIANDKKQAAKRDYIDADLSTIQSLGTAAGYASVIVLIFYFTSPEATELYRSPIFLWAVGPLMLFWISRMFVLAGRGHMHDDPIVFTAKDRTSMAVGALILIAILLANFVSVQ